MSEDVRYVRIVNESVRLQDFGVRIIRSVLIGLLCVFLMGIGYIMFSHYVLGF